MKLEATRVGDRIQVRASRPIRDALEDALGKIPGCSIDKKRTRAAYGLNYRTARNLRNTFGKRLRFDAALTDWLWAEQERRDDLAHIAAGNPYGLATLAQSAPEVHARLWSRAWQPVGVSWLLRSRRGTLADDPGLGKTLQAIATVLEDDLRGPILVLAPSSSIPLVWVPELMQWTPEEDSIHPITGNRYAARSATTYASVLDPDNYPEPHRADNGDPIVRKEIYRWNIPGPRTQCLDKFLENVQDFPEDRHWAMCNYEMVRADSWPELFEIQWSAIICDEGHKYLLTRTSVAKKQSQQRAGVSELKVKPGGLKIVLTGTPYMGRPESYWGTLNWLWPLEYKAYWAWVDNYFEVLTDGERHLVNDIAEGRMRAFTEDRDATMLRRAAEEVRPDMPEKLYPGEPLDPGDPNSPHGIWLPMDPRQAKVYNEMRLEALARLESGDLLANSPLAEITRLRQFAGSHGDMVGERFEPRLPSNKYAWLLEWLAERGIAKDEWGEAKVIVASQFTGLLKLFYQALREEESIRTGLVIGGQPKVNTRNANRFMDPGDPLRVLLLNLQTGGQALTLDIADDMVILDETSIPDPMIQLEGRIRRPAGHRVKAGCMYWYVRSLETVEEGIATTALGRRTLQDYLLDGSRGVTLLKRLVEGK